MIIQCLQNPVTGNIDFCHDDQGSRSPTIFNSFIEDEQAVAGSVTNGERLNGANSIDELKMDDFVLISEEESGSLSDLDMTAALEEIGKLTCIDKSESNNLELIGNLEHQNRNANVSISAVSDEENSAHIDGSPSDVITGEAMSLVQTKDVISFTEVAEACHLVDTDDGFKQNSCNGEDKMPRSEHQHSKKKFSAMDSDQDDRYAAKTFRNF